MAPELEGSESFIEGCVNNNIVVSIGHTGATYEEAMNAIGKGVKSFTHTFNAMAPCIIGTQEQWELHWTQESIVS